MRRPTLSLVRLKSVVRLHLAAVCFFLYNLHGVQYAPHLLISPNSFFKHWQPLLQLPQTGRIYTPLLWTCAHTPNNSKQCVQLAKKKENLLCEQHNQMIKTQPWTAWFPSLSLVKVLEDPSATWHFHEHCTSFLSLSQTNQSGWLLFAVFYYTAKYFAIVCWSVVCLSFAVFFKYYQWG